MSDLAELRHDWQQVRQRFDEWQEEDHPRDEDGKFTSGGGAGPKFGGSFKEFPGAHKVSKILNHPSLSDQEKLATILRLKPTKEESQKFHAEVVAYLKEKLQGEPPPAKPKSEPPPPPTPEPPPEPKPAKQRDYPKTMADVLAKRESRPGRQWTREERDWHTRKNTWDVASPRFLSAMANTRSLSNITTRTTTSSHYMRGEHTINMATDDPITWRHEFGHAMDHGNRLDGEQNITRSWQAERHRIEEARYLTNLRERAKNEAPTMAHLTKSFEGTGLTVEQGLEFTKRNGFRALNVARVLNEEASKQDVMNAAPRSREGLFYDDFLGALTGNKMGSGHSNEYYRSDETKATSEMFANYVALTEGPGGDVYRKLLHKLAPRCCEHFDKMIEERANERT